MRRGLEYIQTAYCANWGIGIQRELLLAEKGRVLLVFVHWGQRVGVEWRFLRAGYVGGGSLYR